MWLFYIDYLFIELPENMLYRDIYIVIEILNDLYRGTTFWPHRPALRHHLPATFDSTMSTQGSDSADMTYQTTHLTASTAAMGMAAFMKTARK